MQPARCGIKVGTASMTAFLRALRERVLKHGDGNGGITVALDVVDAADKEVELCNVDKA